MVALPLILAALWYALHNQFQIHRRIARWTFPIWLYVSVTGVIVLVLGVELVGAVDVVVTVVVAVAVGALSGSVNG